MNHEELLENETNLLRTYAQSYLKWLHTQNYRMKEMFSSEEIYNYFLLNLIHPIWFNIMLQTKPVNTIITCYNLIDKYKDNAGEFDEYILIKNKSIIDFSLTNSLSKKIDATIKQKNVIRNNNDKYHFISEIDLQKLNKNEASVLIDYIFSGKLKHFLEGDIECTKQI